MKNNTELGLHCQNLPIETEVKILEIDAEKLQNTLLERGAIRKFVGRVYDIFFDFWGQNELGEQSRILDAYDIGLRIRQKTHEITGEVKYNYTLKKDVETEVGVKSCLEYEGNLDEEGKFEEFLEKLRELISSETAMTDAEKQKFSKIFENISSPENFSGLAKFEWFLEKFLGMERVQIRDKKRISYVLGGENFDIDTYEWVPTFLEIEAKNRARIDEILQDFWLQNHTILSCGYRDLMEYYGKTA